MENNEEKSTPEDLKRFIDQYQEAIEEAAEYIENKNWAVRGTAQTFNQTIEEHKVEWNVINNTSSHLEYFTKEADGHLNEKFAQDFIKILKDLLEGYIERSNNYRRLNKWTEIENDENYKAQQITFQDSLLKNISLIRKKLGKINLDDVKEVKKIPIHGDKKVPFLMRDKIEELYPSQFKK